MTVSFFCDNRDYYTQVLLVLIIYYLFGISAYFVLWDRSIIELMLKPNSSLGRRALRDLLTLEKPESNSSVDKASKFNSPYRNDWLKTAQNDMVDIEKLRMQSKLVGKMYGLSREYSMRENGHWDIYNNDSVAFAKAYKDAMVSNVRRACFLIYLI